MRNYFTIGGRASTDFGVYISGQGTFNSPQKAYDFRTIPGRNGDLILSDNRLMNTELSYNCFIYTNFDANLADLRAFLLSLDGYQELSDTYHPNEFRMAAYAGPLLPEVTAKNDAGSFTLTFNCKPQRFLTSGKTVTTTTVSTTITNPTEFDALPLIRAYGTGRFRVNNGTVKILAVYNQYTDIDCENLDCYEGTQNRNSNVEIDGYAFPRLEPGSNAITIVDNTITKLEITPRWWRV